MDPESKKILESTFKLAEENNKLLLHIRRSQKVASFMWILYVLFILGAGIGAFYFTQPYVEQIQKFVKDSGDTFNSFKNVSPKQ